MSVNSKMTALMNAIRSKAGISGLLSLDAAKTAVDNIQTGITPTGNINITDTNVTDVTNYETAKVVDANLIAENIKKNISILGVLGEFEGGSGSLPSVISKIDGGSFTLASDIEMAKYSIKHNLGVIPKGIMCWTEDNDLAEEHTHNTTVNYYILANPFNTGSTDAVANWLCYWRRSTGATATVGSALTQAQFDNFVSNTGFAPNRAEYYKAGCTYKWIAWV